MVERTQMIKQLKKKTIYRFKITTKKITPRKKHPFETLKATKKYWLYTQFTAMIVITKQI